MKTKLTTLIICIIANIASFGQNSLKNGVYEFAFSDGAMKSEKRTLIVKNESVVYKTEKTEKTENFPNYGAGTLKTIGVFSLKLEKQSNRLFLGKDDDIEMSISIASANELNIEVLRSVAELQFKNDEKHIASTIELQPEKITTLTFIRDLTTEDEKNLLAVKSEIESQRTSQEKARAEYKKRMEEDDGFPSFPGGEEELMKFLRANMEYPVEALEAGIRGTVHVTFVIERDGSVTDVKVIRGIGGGCDEEAVRVVQMMPNWKIGKNQDAVRVQYGMPIAFGINQ
jgi:TonB family protein